MRCGSSALSVVTIGGLRHGVERLPSAATEIEVKALLSPWSPSADTAEHPRPM
jgi:hypothetical protein